MKMKILIMGLPGSGKSTLSKKLSKMLDAKWLNADEVRKEANDWDFSPSGRIRQANRMKALADAALKNNQHVIGDFICPTPKTREEFNAEYIIWLDTIKAGRYDDTNQLFIPPSNYNFRITTKNAEHWCSKIFDDIKMKIK